MTASRDHRLDDVELAAPDLERARTSYGPYELPEGRRFHVLDPAGNELGAWSEG